MVSSKKHGRPVFLYGCVKLQTPPDTHSVHTHVQQSCPAPLPPHRLSFSLSKNALSFLFLPEEGNYYSSAAAYQHRRRGSANLLESEQPISAALLSYLRTLRHGDLGEQDLGRLEHRLHARRGDIGAVQGHISVRLPEHQPDRD
ncbi:hypothetical protein ACFXTH_028531 [Malus domestica]